MWKTLLTILQSVFTLARDLEENRKEIKELNEKVYALASAVRSLAEKTDANVQHEASERKALVLQIENELLKAGKKISPLKSGGKTTSKKRNRRK
jgi:predicted  nucleic acid-binding Zn-ribbon protein